MWNSDKVIMVPSQTEQGLAYFIVGARMKCVYKPIKPTQTILGKRPNKGILSMELDNSVVRVSHGRGSAGWVNG